jgi:hypothetical protein
MSSNFMSHFFGQLVSTIILSTSKGIDPVCQLKSPPKHFNRISSLAFAAFASVFS